MSNNLLNFQGQIIWLIPKYKFFWRVFLYREFLYIIASLILIHFFEATFIQLFLYKFDFLSIVRVVLIYLWRSFIPIFYSLLKNLLWFHQIWSISLFPGNISSIFDKFIPKILMVLFTLLNNRFFCFCWRVQLIYLFISRTKKTYSTYNWVYKITISSGTISQFLMISKILLFEINDMIYIYLSILHMTPKKMKKLWHLQIGFTLNFSNWID